VEQSEGDQDRERIEIVQEGHARDAGWEPTVGDETISLLAAVGLPQGSCTHLRDQATEILSRCVPPHAGSGDETGLVIGYIQSGKTMSFTTVAALACDNRYAMVIVIAGTSIPLTDQSTSRLRRDLRLGERADRKWRHMHNPRTENQDHRRIADILAEWRDPHVPHEERRPMLVTVMKHAAHLSHLIDVLRQVDLRRLPVLIIDDEADQAGLNNLIRQGDESSTYRRLSMLKRTVPHHTFLQYTATPQGPLLINLIDVLSPGFAAVLVPGDAYVGGRDFFLGADPLVREIPPAEIPTRANPVHQPPASLLQALFIFFLGVADGMLREHGRGNRSMMIHPSRHTVGHGQYHDWVSTIRSTWISILQDMRSRDRGELLADFRRADEDLRATVPDLSPFHVLEGSLLQALRRTEMHLVNAQRGRTPQIDWGSSYSHILVGGQALDRGFTVEGLTVTYMPRGVGGRQADTIQQRARFFGYKRPYLGFCRVFLEPRVADAFRRYVEHEEDVRRRLVDHTRTGRPLSELRRAFLLTRDLRPTRDSIIDIDYIRTSLSEGWFFARAPHDTAAAVRTNQQVVSAFLGTIQLGPDQGHPDRTEFQRHRLAPDLPLRHAFEDLLTRLRFSGLSDAQDFLGVLVAIRGFLDENPDATCTVYEMNCGRPRIRTLNESSEIPTLFQGAAPVNPPERRGEVYPGDQHIRSQSGVTIQLHRLNLRESRSAPTAFENVPDVAVWLPGELTVDLIIQDQGNLQLADE
jgi:hypothetical protein